MLDVQFEEKGAPGRIRELSSVLRELKSLKKRLEVLSSGKDSALISFQLMERI